MQSKYKQYFQEQNTEEEEYSETSSSDSSSSDNEEYQNEQEEEHENRRDSSEEIDYPTKPNDDELLDELRKLTETLNKDPAKSKNPLEVVSPKSKKQNSNPDEYYIKKAAQYLKQKNVHLDHLREKHYQEEMSKCPFSPKISNYNLNSRPNIPILERFEKLKSRREDELNRKRKEIREAQTIEEMKDATFHPTINNPSNKKKIRSTSDDDLLRLTLNPKKRMVKPFEDPSKKPTFKPKINQNSEILAVIKKKLAQFPNYIERLQHDLESIKQKRELIKKSITPSFQPAICKGTQKILDNIITEKLAQFKEQFGHSPTDIQNRSISPKQISEKQSMVNDLVTSLSISKLEDTSKIRSQSSEKQSSLVSSLIKPKQKEITSKDSRESSVEQMKKSTSTLSKSSLPSASKSTVSRDSKKNVDVKKLLNENQADDDEDAFSLLESNLKQIHETIKKFKSNLTPEEKNNLAKGNSKQSGGSKYASVKSNEMGSQVSTQDYMTGPSLRSYNSNERESNKDHLNDARNYSSNQAIPQIHHEEFYYVISDRNLSPKSHNLSHYESVPIASYVPARKSPSKNIPNYFSEKPVEIDDYNQFNTENMHEINYFNKSLKNYSSVTLKDVGETTKEKFLKLDTEIKLNSPKKNDKATPKKTSPFKAPASFVDSKNVRKLYATSPSKNVPDLFSENALGTPSSKGKTYNKNFKK